MPTRELITLRVNGSTHELAVRPYDVLLDVLRENLNLTGTKRGCDMGTCGCCTVHLDGEPRLACLTLAMEAVGREVRTIEGLKDKGLLHPLQRAFAEYGGSQCGFCTPGFIMTAAALLAVNPHPTREEIKEAISGNLCRCTGYVKIVDAIAAVARTKAATVG
ncbi:MAG: (2Fe-2S)-binding protein [candidate division KSB1 bacterium]|nr:(2Fe-2S)-binding protein [candidate division KSB1 bacterium]MDZ7272677.1 (2Fe-2S)-binding protein [candidate division KSB1 bacterium]MDZ7284301.1 (2Fe-2S)-binding protein [candidate division KSB1 bacterium]MDZ7297303.1 (2Fe-2S)-binding protein [candidate division KSB1 bacterium]MDZ7309004.1 (2Fe-2S)-binding protein [candidate division KSB1 bacterium]